MRLSTSFAVALWIASSGVLAEHAVQDTLVSRGRYLANGIARCFYCHSPLDHQDPAVPIAASLGSGDVLDAKAPTVASNITPDQETGVGRWSNQEIIRAIREGIDRDGRHLAEHPANYYSVMTDEDASSIVSYLRSLKPIRRQLPRSAPPRDDHATVQRRVTPARSGSLRTPVERGAYLVQLGECVGCHTPPKSDGSPARVLTFAGGRRFRVEQGAGSELSPDPTFRSATSSPSTNGKPPNGRIVVSANITPAPSGISYFSEEIFIQTIRTGKVAGVRPLSAAMPWVFFRILSDGDLRDVFAYLRTVRPIEHRVDNYDPPTWCPRCGRWHGLGASNTIWPK